MTRALAIGLLVATSACFSYSPPPPERPPPVLRKIQDAEILEMKVHLYKQLGLCPGLEGKMYVNANVRWGASKPVPRSLGSDVDSLQPSDFVVTGPLLKADAKAHLFPDPDVQKSIDTGFDATIVYKPNPKFTFKENFPPEYSCYGGWFADGGTGGTGAYGGDSGNNGYGTPGQPGGHGGPGGAGEPGGKIVAYVTIVVTRYYPRLLAVIANNNFFLAPADRELLFGAAGGQGGNGGNGGWGGNGGDQATEAKEIYDKDSKSKRTVMFGVGVAGNGGRGGNGGTGGQGGRGGTVEVTYDSTFPELSRLLKVDVRGGAPGWGGAEGGGGNGGGTNAEKNAKQGNPGQPGQPGGNGRPGGDGTGVVRAGSVNAKFANIRGIAIFGTPQAKAMQQSPPAGAVSAAPHPPAPPPPPHPHPAKP